MSAFGDLCRVEQPLLGLWQALASAYCAEICAGAGYDWLLFDGEHAPNTLPTLLAQLQAINGHKAHPIARVPCSAPWVIKQYLDLGFPTLLVPMVDSAREAKEIVAATRFPTRGIRGVASATSRASQFGADRDYLAQSHERVGVIAQIESRGALAEIDAIAATPGIDALFVGPSDLAASLNHLGDPRHNDVQDAIARALSAIRKAGKPAGIFALDLEDARQRIDQGFKFVSVGTDIGLLARSARSLVDRLKPG